MNLSESQKKEFIKHYPELSNYFEQESKHEELKKAVSESSKLPPEIVAKIKSVKGEKGDKGDKGDAGYTPIRGKDFWTTEDVSRIENIKNELDTKYKDVVSLSDDILKRATPKKGFHYTDGKNGKDGRDGKRGERGPTGIGIQGKSGRDGSPDKPEQIASKLNSLKEAVDVSVIKGAASKKDINDGMQKIEGRIKLIDLRWHGGGISKVSHDSSLSGDGTPSNPLSAVSSGGVTILTATGTINDSNTVFGFTTLPTEIVVNGGSYIQTGGAITWTWNSGTLQATLSSPVGTGGSIYGRK